MKLTIGQKDGLRVYDECSNQYIGRVKTMDDEGKQERPVFFDETGRRWKILKALSLLVCSLTFTLLYWLIPLSLGKEELVAFRTTQILANPDLQAPASNFIDEIYGHVSSMNTPVFGQGPMVRVVKIDRHSKTFVATDPFTKSTSKILNEQDIKTVGDHSYAIERYGQTHGKRLALTFDDGPHPIYTPQLLDVLSRHKAPSSFFVTGTNVVKYPEIAKRIVREGHALGNHTFTHIDFNFTENIRAEQEINLTQRIIRATTHHNPAYFRIPYGGHDDQSMRDSIKGILHAQELGYTPISYHFDTEDWSHTAAVLPPMPEFGDTDQILLLHDGGGNRHNTVKYVEQVILAAKAKGYKLVNLEQLYPHPVSLFATAKPNVADESSLFVAKMLLVWPHAFVIQLFVLSLTFVFCGIVLNILFASLQIRRTRHQTREHNYHPLVSIVVPAYNEGLVLRETIHSLLQSTYKNLEIIIVDDGSRDNTLQVARRLKRQGSHIHVLHQDNRGKARALNRGIKNARGEVVICIDADTIFIPDTVDKLVRHFADPQVGGVAGVVRVGNVHNILTRWQALEYIVGIHIERNAQAYLKAILVVPGACGAWRKAALQKTGGYSNTTLAEDCDLTLAVHEAGYQIIQDNEAIAHTETPLNLSDLAKQRFRWTFGNIQSFWKHRHMIFNRKYSWLGAYVLPAAVTNTLLPLIFLPLLVVLTIENLAAGQFHVLLIFMGATMLLQFFVAGVGLLLARENWRFLFVVPVTRLVYGPLRTYLLYRSTLTAVRGAYVGWNKLTRSGTMAYVAAEHQRLSNRLWHTLQLLIGFRR